MACPAPEPVSPRSPHVHLEISTDIWAARDMAEDADLEIRYSLRPPDQVVSELLWTDHYYPVCAPGYPVTWNTLHQQPLYDCFAMAAAQAFSVWLRE